MPKKLDPVVAEVLRKYGFGSEAIWDCHGTWVVYHWALEQIAAKAGIVFDAPLVLEANGPAKSAALCVTGDMSGKREWSIGEAAPGNNKNAYPYAMAEKRAKDRVVLKLVGLHGLVYSEEEADAFNGGSRSPAEPDNAALDEQAMVADLIEQMQRVSTVVALDALRKDADFVSTVRRLSKEGLNSITIAGRERRAQLEARMKPGLGDKLAASVKDARSDDSVLMAG